MKKMKLLKKTLSLVLVLVLSIMIIPQEVYAMESTENLISPLYIDIDAFQIGFDVFDDGRMLCYAYLVSGSADRISITIYLQKKVGDSWNIVDTFYESTINSQSCIVDGDRYVAKGTYRIMAIGYVYREGRLTDSDTFISWTDTYS